MPTGKPKRAFMWAATLGFGGIGLIMLIVGPDADTRLIGLACIGLFGVGGGLFLWTTRPRGAVEPIVNVGRTELLGVSETGVELPVEPAIKPVVSFVFMFGLGAGLIAFGVLGGAIFPGVIGVLILGFFAYAVATHVRNRSVRSRVVLTATGFVIEQPIGSHGVRWSDVDSLTLFTNDNVLHLGIDAPSEAIVQGHGSTAGTRLGRAIAGAAIVVPALSLPADPERLLVALDDYAGDPSPLRDPERERSRLAARLAAPA